MAESSPKWILTIVHRLQEICAILTIISILGVTISINPDVQWNQYKDDPYGVKLFAQSSHTLWESMDASRFQHCDGSGIYIQILKNMDGDSDRWKAPIRDDLYKAIGLMGGALLVLILSYAVHMVTKQKLFTSILMLAYSAVGSIGGYFMVNARHSFKEGLSTVIAKKAVAYYNKDRNDQKLGYDLVLYSAILLWVAACIHLCIAILYIKFVEGKWIWKRKEQTHILPI